MLVSLPSKHISRVFACKPSSPGSSPGLGMQKFAQWVYVILFVRKSESVNNDNTAYMPDLFNDIFVVTDLDVV